MGFKMPKAPKIGGSLGAAGNTIQKAVVTPIVESAEALQRRLEKEAKAAAEAASKPQSIAGGVDPNFSMNLGDLSGLAAFSTWTVPTVPEIIEQGKDGLKDLAAVDASVRNNLGVLQKDLQLQPQPGVGFNPFAGISTGELAKAFENLQKNMVGVTPGWLEDMFFGGDTGGKGSGTPGETATPGSTTGAPGTGTPEKAPYGTAGNPIFPGGAGGPGGTGGTGGTGNPLDYNALDTRFNLLLANAGRNESRNLEQTQNALSRKFAAMGMTDTGAAAGAAGQAAQASAQNMSNLEAQLGGEKANQMFQGDEAQKERVWKSQEAQADREFSYKELGINEEIARSNMKISAAIQAANNKGLISGIFGDLFGANANLDAAQIGAILGGIGGFFAGGPWGAAAGATAGGALGSQLPG